ncbi:MAG: MaoC family dehydratase N-terminal domain-containing protein [Deltaproteobacteria bacterium]|jgi:acyl dehydratase|nr:MaoC family dehydratase N-terminal domain-containing protein [Deltaproteobacteria bacterium]
MEISSDYVGTILKPYRGTLQWRDTMNYAAAIHDDNPHYFDDERREGIIAPPMFAVAATWPIIENLPEFIETDAFPQEVLLTLVHYTEHIRFHRPLVPGQSLSIQGRVAAIMPHRAGTQIVICFEALDQHNQPVFTEYNGGMLRGVQSIDGAKGTRALPAVPDREPGAGLRWEQRIWIDPLLPFVYDGCANIVFPIHTSRKFAHRVGLPGIILQGTATLALAVRELINREGGGNPLKLKELYCRFTGMVLPGSEIKIRAYFSKDPDPAGNFYFDVINQEGKKAISHGYALIQPPDTR